MKILLLVNGTNSTGGTGRNARNLKSALSHGGNAVDIIELNKNLLNFIKRTRAKARDADIVYAVDMNPVGFAAYIATRFLQVKFVIIAQAAYSIAPLHNKKTALFSKTVYRSADAVIAGSSFVALEIQKKIPDVPVQVIDPGIDLSHFTSPVKREIAIPPFILSVGAVKMRKGQDVSLQAFAIVKKDIPDLKYVIVGSQVDEPEYFKKVQLLARDLKVDRSVEFCSNISDEQLKGLYNAASLFVLTSVNIGFHFEGFGMVFLEAAAHGIPSVGTSGNGIADSVEDGKTGILVPQKDVQATALAIRRILTDKLLYEQMSLRAQEFAHEHDIARLSQRYQEINEQLIRPES